jgi:hypothetical protein
MTKSIFMGIVVVIVTACNPSTKNKKDMTAQTNQIEMVEITTFQLNEGISIEVFTKAVETMHEQFLAKQAGFKKRTLTVSEDGKWTDIVFWEDQGSFESAMQKAESSQHTIPFMEKIDFNSVKMLTTKPVLITE